MSFPKFDVALKKEKINIFKIGSLWSLKYFFADKEIFNALLEFIVERNTGLSLARLEEGTR